MDMMAFQLLKKISNKVDHLENKFKKISPEKRRQHQRRKRP